MADVKNTAIEKEEPKKKSFGSKFVNFLAMGGFMIILIGGVAIFVLVSILMK